MPIPRHAAEKTARQCLPSSQGRPGYWKSPSNADGVNSNDLFLVQELR